MWELYVICESFTVLNFGIQTVGPCLLPHVTCSSLKFRMIRNYKSAWHDNFFSESWIMKVLYVRRNSGRYKFVSIRSFQYLCLCTDGSIFYICERTPRVCTSVSIAGSINVFLPVDSIFVFCSVVTVNQVWWTVDKMGRAHFMVRGVWHLVMPIVVALL